MEELQELQKINVKKSNGEVAEAEVLLCFELEKTGKSYIIYTFNEVDSQNMETFHASVITENENGYQLDTMPEDEWKIVKEIMRDMIRNEE
ncbi:MAG: DUF1292 domain-containing protein [Bacilli bacterium]|nr:DUF1292 domain-containing protein [Bacilli bacterium]